MSKKRKTRYHIGRMDGQWFVGKVKGKGKHKRVVGLPFSGDLRDMAEVWQLLKAILDKHL
jgi:hypothetical protein